MFWNRRALREEEERHVVTGRAIRSDAPRPGGGNRVDDVLTHWALRLVVVLSMLAALVSGVVGTAAPASASAYSLWTQLSPVTSPSALSGASIAYDPATGQTILFGGNASGTALSGTWSWNGSTWTQLSPVTSPAPRYGAALAYDGSTDQLLLFGGYDGSAYYADTWTWTGTTWSQLTPTTSPGSRTGASLAYDPVSGGQMLLFGGYNGASYLQDTWSWSGTSWTALTPAAKPSVREEGSFAYDTSSSQMLLFGGYNSGDLADTWSWTGTTWSALSPTLSPSARYGAPMAYIPALGELALFGGQGAAYDTDTWAWNGTTWGQLPSSTSPSARVLPAMTFDPATSQMVLFGGYNGSSYLGDTWQWSAVAVTAVSPIAGPASGGESVTITGAGFNGVTAVQFGSTNATSYSVTNSTQIVAVAPAESVGPPVDITVTNPANTSAVSSADQFTYEATPTVTSLSPASGALVGGTSVTITGTNLTGATAVDFGVQAATAYTVVSQTSITATSPAVASATSVDLTVTTPVATSAAAPADQFTYNPVPTVTGVSPSTGNTAGGTAVTITGTGLTGATAVKFGSVSATSFSISSATSISVTSPAGSGSVDVTVTVAGGTSATSPADQFTYETGPTVTAVSPMTALVAGGTTVTITGTNFTGVDGVSFGSTAAASYSFNSSTAITAMAPAGSAGTVDVTVTTPSATSGTSAADGFTYEGGGGVPPSGSNSVPGAPANVVATAGDLSARVSWREPTDNGSAILSYRVTALDVTTSSNGGESCVASGVSTTACSVEGLTSGDSYTFTVTATNAIGTGPASGASNAVTPMTVPGAPTHVVAAGGNASATVSWTAPASDGGSAITRYVVIASGTGEQACTTAGVTCTVTNLHNGTTYTFSVTAANVFGTGPASGASKAVTLGAHSRTVLQLSTATLTYGAEQAEHLSVRVSSTSSASTPTGTVKVSEAGVTLCTITLSTGTGACGLGATELAAGDYHVVATYRGNKSYGRSAATVSLRVVKASSTITFGLSSQTLGYGDEQAENMSVTVASQYPGAAPSGIVTIRGESLLLCTITLSAGAGSCSLTAAQLAVGSPKVFATYHGGRSLLGSAAGQRITVTRPSSKTTLGLSSSTLTYGAEQTERLSVTVAPGYPIAAPTGTVNLSQSGITLCNVTLSSGAGSCTLGASQLGVGNFHIVAAYRGDVLFAPSVTGARLLVTARSVTALNLSATELIYGNEQAENMSVTVRSQYRGSKPTGLVTISNSGVALCAFALSSGTGACRLSAKQLSVGADSIVASYRGSEFLEASSTSDAVRIVA